MEKYPFKVEFLDRTVTFSQTDNGYVLTTQVVHPHMYLVFR
jgi:hypothetical protein